MLDPSAAVTFTRIEKDIAKMEGKKTLGPSDKRKIKRLLEQVKDDDKEFEERHIEVLNYINEEHQDAIDAEEEVYDAHGCRVMEIIEKLEQLEVAEESVSLPTVPLEDPSHSQKEVTIPGAGEAVNHRVFEGNHIRARKSQAIAFAKTPRA